MAERWYARRLQRWRFRYRLLSLACSWMTVCAFAIPSQQHPGSKDFVISKEIDLVVLPVTVTDRKGQFVSGLSTSDFQVYENGRQQSISLFRNEEVAVTVGLVVDHSGSMVANQKEVIEGARAFVQESDPLNREFVVNFGNTVDLGLPSDLPFTSNVTDLEKALSAPSASGRTALFDAVLAGLQHLQEAHTDHKVLLLISDGGDNASTHTFPQVLRAAQAANVAIYAIGLLNEYNADQNPGLLKKLTGETGGVAYFPDLPSEVVADCRDIARDIRHQYTLGYELTDSSRSGYRKIRVRVSARGRGRLTVRTRAGYFVPPAVPEAQTVH